MLMIQTFNGHSSPFCESDPKHLCFRGVYVSCTLSVQTSHFLLTILVLPYFGATIAIQN